MHSWSHVRTHESTLTHTHIHSKREPLEGFLFPHSLAHTHSSSRFSSWHPPFSSKPRIWHGFGVASQLHTHNQPRSTRHMANKTKQHFKHLTDEDNQRTTWWFTLWYLFEVERKRFFACLWYFHLSMWKYQFSEWLFRASSKSSDCQWKGNSLRFSNQAKKKKKKSHTLYCFKAILVLTWHSRLDILVCCAPWCGEPFLGCVFHKYPPLWRPFWSQTI